MAAIRVNMTLPEDVVKLLNKKAKPGEKSAYIAEAIRQYARKESQEELMNRMIEGYITTAEEDLALYRELEGSEGDGIEDETW
jgi:metal-responsive CopG/Arc/MetJ family transcriptional regulator